MHEAFRGAADHIRTNHVLIPLEAPPSSRRRKLHHFILSADRSPPDNVHHSVTSRSRATTSPKRLNLRPTHISNPSLHNIRRQVPARNNRPPLPAVTQSRQSPCGLGRNRPRSSRLGRRTLGLNMALRIGTPNHRRHAQPVKLDLHDPSPHTIPAPL